MRLTVNHAGWLLPALVVLVYWPSLDFPFQFDDYNVIVDQPAVQSLSAWWRSMPGIRPLLKLSYALNWALSPEPAAFRQVNIGLHGMNALMVWLLLSELARQRALPAIVPLLAAALFAVHPIQTEAVTYVCGRSVSLMAFFYLLSVLAWLHATRTGRTGLKLLSVLAFLGAFLSKETAIILPAALWLVSRLTTEVPARRPASPSVPMALAPRTSVRSVLSAYRWPLAVAAGALVFLLALPAYRDFLSISLAQRTPLDNLALQVDAIFTLTGNLLLPARMNADPGWSTTAQWDVLLAVRAMLLALLIGLAAWAFRQRSFAGFCVLWFFLHLAPTNSVLPRLDVVNDRQLYLAAIGAFAGFALIIWRTAHWLGSRLRTQPALACLGPTLLAALLGATMAGWAGWQTVKRNQVYRDEMSFWQDVTAKSPQNARAFNNLGYAYQLAGRPQEARAAYRRALALAPSLPQARWNLEVLPLEGMPADTTAGTSAGISAVTTADTPAGTTARTKGHTTAAPSPGRPSSAR